MSEQQALYLFKGKPVMVGDKKGIVVEIPPSGPVKVRLADGTWWIGPPAKLSECEEERKPFIID